jgi:hypothetical protein
MITPASHTVRPFASMVANSGRPDPASPSLFGSETILGPSVKLTPIGARQHDSNSRRSGLINASHLFPSKQLEDPANNSSRDVDMEAAVESPVAVKQEPQDFSSNGARHLITRSTQSDLMNAFQAFSASSLPPVTITLMNQVDDPHELR